MAPTTSTDSKQTGETSPRGTCCVVADRVRPDRDALPPLVLTTDEAEGLHAASVLPFPSVAVAQDQDRTILLIKAIESDGFKSLKEGQTVSFVAERGAKGHAGPPTSANPAKTHQ